MTIFLKPSKALVLSLQSSSLSLQSLGFITSVFSLHRFGLHSSPFSLFFLSLPTHLRRPIFSVRRPVGGYGLFVGLAGLMGLMGSGLMGFKIGLFWVDQWL